MLQQLFLLDHLGGGERRGARHRVAAVAAGGGDGLEALLVRLAHGHAGDGESVAEALADRDHVGDHAPVFRAEPLSGATPAGQDFVHHQQQLPRVAELAQLREEIVGRHDRSAPALDRLEHEAGHRADGRLVEVLVVECEVLVSVDGPVGLLPHRPVGIGTRHHMRAGRAHRAVDVRADVAERHRPVGLAVVIVEARDRLVLAGRGAQDADARLHRDGA